MGSHSHHWSMFPLRLGSEARGGQTLNNNNKIIFSGARVLVHRPTPVQYPASLNYMDSGVPPGVLLECRARNNPQVLPGMTQKQI